MIMVRQWMTHFSTLYSTLLGFMLIFVWGCNPTEITSSGQRIGTSFANGELANRAYIYRDSPYILEGPNYGPNVNMKGSVDQSLPEFITNKSQLKGDCSISLFNGSSLVADCLHTFASKTASQQVLPRNADGTWIFPTNSSEFYQVNGHFHVQKGINTFFDKLKFAYDNLYSNPLFVSKTKSIPYYLPQTNMYWFQAITPPNDNYFRNSFLSNYTLCNFETNARFSPASPELCFGNWSAHPTFLMIQDPSIIYHELGHALIAIMMNFRNATPGFSSPLPIYHSLRSNLGGYGYNEAGSLGEGIADYYSFVMNKRTHFGEWGLGKSVNASRPMSEDDPMHISGISTTPEGRLSYPQYLHYDPNAPNVPYEDVHYAGQIVSHYMVALTKSIQTDCSLPSENSHDISTSYVMMLLAETLSELGDLNAVGLDSWGSAYNPSTFTPRFNNLDENASYIWSHIVNPPTYRRFFQIFSKNIYKYITNGFCTAFTKDESEKLLDDYGLLLFKTYNNNGSSTKNKNLQYDAVGSVNVYPTPMAPTMVHENNRRKSVLVSKELLSLATPDLDRDVATYYIIDDQTTMSAILQSLLFKGFPLNLSTGIASVEYNNTNIKISPGEIVAIVPNLFNSSNSTISGVQLLANDWDHVHITDTSNGNFKPCVYPNDLTTVAQGGEAGATCTTTMTSYKRNVKNGSTFASEAAAPVCLVQLEEGEVSRWVSQNEFRMKKQGLSLQDKDCLGYSGTAYTDDFTFNPHECLVRALPGANSPFYSKIAPQKSYVETMRSGNPDHKFDSGNTIIFEINKWIPPGTKFRCRLRARFSNCSDCFSDAADATNDDYIDAELNGAKPFKIINFEFDVND
jgi:hypothetical protein